MLAQNFGDIQSASGINLKFSSLGELISIIFRDYIFYIVGILLLVYLIVGGLQLMLSRGDPKAVSAAQSKITNAVIGFVIVVIAYFLVRLIGQLFGITIFGTIFSGSGLPVLQLNQ